MEKMWRPNEKIDVHPTGAEIHDPAVFAAVESSIDALDEDLRELSLDISGLHRLGSNGLHLILVLRAP